MADKRKKQTKSETENTNISYVHVDDFLRRKELSPEMKRGFKIFVRGRSYQLSMEAFEEELEKFLNRKI
ncbi:hypothetical protein ACSHUI_00840 [Bacillus subtilis]|uniref:hypothetical protein n=1 Tax=Bacillus subtilis TaxID=1423 RepID=UPI0025C9BC8A|nr:hypothetical protein [Bacillus subtilis]WCS68018.1 hypothetical protein Goe26_01060 [Bacillus phage vB_BsuM-Goe26]GLI90604.1 hypothetical protein ANABIO4_39560 [Bacillus subtilis]